MACPQTDFALIIGRIPRTENPLLFIAAQIMGPHSSASCPVPNGWNLLTDMCRGGGLFQLDLEGTSSQRRSFL